MFRARRRERRPFSGRVVVLLFFVLAEGEWWRVDRGACGCIGRGSFCVGFERSVQAEVSY